MPRSWARLFEQRTRLREEAGSIPAVGLHAALG